MATPHSGPANSRYRWAICALLFWVTTANYIDRGVFGNLAPELQRRIGWTAGQYWDMQVAFQFAYAASLLLGGRLMDVLGLRWGFTLAVAVWGLASMSHALASSVAGFFVVRILLGAGEGGNFPAAIKTTAEWFPRHERALATGIFNSGSNVGGILVPIGLAYLVPLFDKVVIAGHVLGWRGAFLITGAIDLAWIIVWLRCYRRPEDHPRVSAAELALIREGAEESTVKVPWRRLLPLRQTWAFALGKGLTDCMWWFYLVGAPLFFADRFHFTPRQRAVPVACIYVFASVGSIGGGWISGHLIKRGWTANRARKTTLLVCALLVSPVFVASLTGSPWLAVALITLAASAHQAWSANLFSLVGDMFPRRVVASVTGLGGMAGSIGGILLFVVTGRIRDSAIARGDAGDYVAIFVAASAAYLAALALIHLLAPRMEKAEVDS